MKRNQMLEKSFKAQLGDSEWTLIPTGELPDNTLGLTCHDDNTILLYSLSTQRDFLDLLIHESLHAAFPWMREWMVNKVASQIADVLWKVGYRKTK